MTLNPHPDNFCGGNFQDWLEVFLTERCNGSCLWCVEKNGFHPSERASYEVIARAIEESGKKNIILLGGEPLLYKDLRNLLVEIFNFQKPKNVYITTNGSRLNVDFVKKNLMFDEHNALIQGLNISIHHWNFFKNEEITSLLLSDSELRKAISFCRDHAIGIRLNCTCMKGYIDSNIQIEAYVSFAKALGVKSVRFAELKGDDDNFVDLVKLYPQKGMGGLKNPFTECCNWNTEINDVKVNYRLMCGFHTKKRPQIVANKVTQYPKRVLYYDGKFYDGWQVKKEEERNNMTDKELISLLESVRDKKISVPEALLKIDRAFRDKDYLLQKQIESDKKKKSTSGTGHCQY